MTEYGGRRLTRKHRRRRTRRGKNVDGGRRRTRSMRGGVKAVTKLFTKSTSKLTKAPAVVATAPNITRGVGSRSLVPRGEIPSVQTMNPVFGKAGTAARAVDDLPLYNNPAVQKGVIAAQLQNEKVMNTVDRLNTAPGNVFSGFNPGFMPRTKYDVEIIAPQDPRNFLKR